MGISAMVWVAPDGTQVDLMGNGVRLLETPIGLGMTPWRWEQLPSPEGHGALFTQAYAGPRSLDLMVLVCGADFEARMAALDAAFNTSRGDGTLRVTRQDGVTRELVCRYESGLEGANINRMDADSGAVVIDGIAITGRWAILPLRFRAAEPFWLGDGISVTIGPGDGVPFFPILPLNLSPEGVFASQVVNNSGDVEAWPVWTVTGPGANLQLENLDTGEVFALGHVLIDGETVTIDTRPGHKSVVSSLQGDLWGEVMAWQMWALAVGQTNVQVRLQDPGVNSAVSLWFRPRYVSLES